MSEQDASNTFQVALGSPPKYRDDARFVSKIFPYIDCQTAEEFHERTNAEAKKGPREGWLTRWEFPGGSAGFLFLQARALMSGVERLPRELSVARFWDIDVQDDGSARVHVPRKELSEDSKTSENELMKRLGSTMTIAHDASTGIDLIETIASSARTVTADVAYDTLAFYETANTRGTTVVVPTAKTATLSRRNRRSSARDGTIRRISKIGRRRWKKEVGYHRQARVENAFFLYTSILGDRLRRRTRAAQAVESVLACNVLNRMTELGRPESCAIDR